MKTNNITLINMYNILDKCSIYKFPQKIAFAIMKNIKILQLDVDTYETSFQKLEEKYINKIQKDEQGIVKRNANGSPIFISTQDAEEFFKEYSELADIEIEVDLYQIDEELFNYDDIDGKYDALTPKDAFALQSILCKQD